MRQWFVICLLVMLSALAGPLRADPVSLAGDSVVRVIAAGDTGDGNFEIGTGTGFAISKTRIVTNAHVVDLVWNARGDSDLQVVPSNGIKRLRARIVAFDPDKDLALIEADEADFKPLTLFGGAFREGTKVVALGYPGNVDRLTGASVIRPQAPVRSEGNFSNFRKAYGAEQLLHTADIAHGNSGGPLLDQCGRVLGVNTLVTENQQGDASFGFAISFNELRSFLRRENQQVALVDDECVSEEELANRKLLSDAEKARQQANAEAEQRRRDETRQRNALAEIQDQRENRMALAALALVLAALVGGYAMIAHGKGEAQRAKQAGGGAVVLLLAAIALFWSRPSLPKGDELPPVQPGAESSVEASDGANGAASDESTGSASSAPGSAKLSCTIDEGRSDYYQTQPAPLEFSIDDAGCVNGRTQYVRSGNGAWQRVSVPKKEAVVSRLTWDPKNRTYYNERWYPDEATLSQVRAVKGRLTSQSCGIDASTLRQLTEAQRETMDNMQTEPDERLVYRCTGE